MSLELEVLDQLAGGDMAVTVLRARFKDVTHFERAILALVEAGEIEVLDTSDSIVALWRLQKLSREVAAWWDGDTLRARITHAGARRV